MRKRSAPKAHPGVTFCACMMLASCGGGGDGDNNGPEPDVNPGLPEVVTITPENIGDGWRISSPEAEGMDGNMLLSGLQAIRDGAYPGVDSVVIVKNNALIAEGYFNGFARESLHDVRSASKSITSALAGIAIAQVLFGIDDPIAQHIPQFESHANMDDRKRAITIRHLLHMNSGLDCNDWIATSPGNEERMYDSPDWVRFILNLPMVRGPGQGPAYCTGGVVVLGHAISTASGMTLDNFANTYLFGPLGVQNTGWRRSPDGRATGGGGMRLRPRDAAKFGSLYLNAGQWNGVPVLPEAWVEQSKDEVHRLGRDGYGLLWWKRQMLVPGPDRSGFFASGNGGNFIFVIPAHHLLVVFTGSNYNSELMNRPFDILDRSVLPAIR
jgi:CubicO group peptidase (beta-lactamase class C family)